MMLLLPTLASATTEKPKVVASIQPLYLISQELLGDQADVERLMPLGASPHGFQLSWSQRRLLDEADLIVWVGPSLELFIEKVISTRPNLSLDSVPSAIETTATIGTSHARSLGESHDHASHNHVSHNHEAHGRDPHLWLDPENALIIARQLIDHLKKLLNDEQEHARLEEKYRTFAKKIDATNRQLQADLRPVQSVPFIVFHDALQHFQQHYGLMPYQVVTRLPEQRPGAKHLHQLRQRIEQGQCLLVEPYYSAAQTRRLQSEFNLVVEEIDILGAEANSYTDFLLTLASGIKHCLVSSAE